MKKNKNNDKSKMNINKKELIITIIVLLISIVIGFIAGKALFEAVYGIA